MEAPPDLKTQPGQPLTRVSSPHCLCVTFPGKSQERSKDAERGHKPRYLRDRRVP